MLRPQLNNFRFLFDQSGIWKFKLDPENIGEIKKWFNDFDSGIQVAVPGSWNEQIQENGSMDYLGSVWYSKNIFIPKSLSEQKIWLWIGSADYYCKVWLNGSLVCEHEGGFLPINFEITKTFEAGSVNKLVIKLNNELNSETIPQGVSKSNYIEENRRREETYPPARFDFFPYGGIQRPVYIYTTSQSFINDIRLRTFVGSGSKGIVEVVVNSSSLGESQVSCKLEGYGFSEQLKSVISNDKAEIVFNVNNCEFWSIDKPALYNLKVSLLNNLEIVDEYSLKVGIREIRLDGYKLLLNNKPVFLKGFGKHEDFPVIGRSLSNSILIKDFSLLKWINANSFRASHYPYAEEFLDIADEMGFLVIDEVPAVSLDFRHVTAKTLEAHKSMIKKLIDRDKNHPCVISWALGNEPNLAGEQEYHNGSGLNYWQEVFAFAKSLDSTRLFTVPNCPRAGFDDPVFKLSDYISLNRYYGWYEDPGQIKLGSERMEEEMEMLIKKYNKPIFVSEFGTDTVAGLHSISDQMFTEEYQAKFIEEYCKLIESKPYTIGEHVWNFADFRTPQIFRRVVNNLKGVFTRIREPKLAAFKLKEHWSKINN
jgi:beta-glucuronidase